MVKNLLLDLAKSAINKMFTDISKPSLIVNEAICKRNIKKMVQKASRNNVIFRPHFKTHQSSSIGDWFKEEGVRSITVSSVEMATYFADHGWKDITIAFPVNAREINDINLLSDKTSLTLLVDQQASIDYLNNNLSNVVDVMIKIDTGYQRVGIPATHYNNIKKLVHLINNGIKTKFKGFLAHAGHSYNCKNQAAIKVVHEQSKTLLLKLKEHFIETHPKLIISVGDTPTCSTMEDFSWANEIRPGNFVFYDLSQVEIGSCDVNDISVALACPVVGVYELQNKIIIYGGGVHFSKEINNNAKNYGQVVMFKKGKWETTNTSIIVEKLSQEHGTIRANKEFIQNIKIGDLIYVLPIHSCMTANLMKHYITCDGKILLKL